MKKIILTLALAVLACSLPCSAQYSRGLSRHHHYNSSRSAADLVEVSVREAGTLETKMPKGTFEQVRMLRVEGPLNEKDLDFITKLAKRSKVLNVDGKSIDNYLDVDLEYASVMERYGSRYNHDVLPRRAFQYASHLRSIVLPERLKSIGDHAFASCYDLEEVIMPPRVHELGESAFEGCDDLKYFSVPDYLETIGRRCFKGCDKLTRFNMPRDVREIGREAFDGCGVVELYIPQYCQIEDHNLGTMSQLQAIDVDRNNITYSSYDRALYDHSGRSLIQFPAARTGSCQIPDGVEEIGERAFNKSRISEIQLPNTVTHLGESAFAGCSRLTSMWLPDGVVQLPAYVFSECTSLRSIDLGAINLMGESAFRGCSSLQSIKLDGRLQVIAKAAFENCRNLQEVEIPSSVTVMEEKAFHECNALRAIDLSQVSKVNKQAFDRCSSLTTVDLNNVTMVEEKAFYECTSLQHLTLGDGVSYIGKEAFRRCKSLSEVAIPGKTSVIGKEAFRECKALCAITLNEGLQTIEDNALRETAIHRLSLPSTVCKLGKKVAEKCSQLQRIECHAITPPDLAGESNSKIELYVPAQSVTAYQDAKNWKKFKVIKGL